MKHFVIALMFAVVSLSYSAQAGAEAADIKFLSPKNACISQLAIKAPSRTTAEMTEIASVMLQLSYNLSRYARVGDKRCDKSDDVRINAIFTKGPTGGYATRLEFVGTDISIRKIPEMDYKDIHRFLGYPMDEYAWNHASPIVQKAVKDSLTPTSACVTGFINRWSPDDHIPVVDWIVAATKGYATNGGQRCYENNRLIGTYKYSVTMAVHRGSIWDHKIRDTDDSIILSVQIDDDHSCHYGPSVVLSGSWPKPTDPTQVTTALLVSQLSVLYRRY